MDIDDKKKSDNKGKKVAFTGMRKPFGKDNKEKDLYLKLKEKIKEIIVNLIEKESIKYFIDGLALGSDQICASIIIELKKDYDLTLEGVIPCSNQDKFWNPEDKENYHKILSLCDIKTYTSTSSYTKYCMHVRNRYMVDNSDIVIAIWDNESTGGTFKTVSYANKKGVPIIVINPKDINLGIK